MHAIRHRYGLEHVSAIAARARRGRVDAIEVAHGDGLAGLELQLRLRRATPTGSGSRRSPTCIKHARLTTLLLPGIGTVARPQARLRRSACARCASPPTAPRPTSPQQHIEAARELGMDVVRLPDDEPHDARRRSWPQQAKLMEATARTASTSPTPAAR